MAGTVVASLSLRSVKDFSLFDALAIVYLGSSDLGCAALVYESGKRKNERASFLATLAGSTVGTVAGVELVALYATADKGWNTEDLGVAFLIYTGTQSAFAVLGHVLSRRPYAQGTRISWVE